MIKTIKSNCFILFYELMGIIFTPIIWQSVARVYRLCIPMKNSSYASLPTFQHPLRPSSGGGPQFILIPYWNFLVYFTHGASCWWTVKLYPRPTLRLATIRPHVSILVRLCSQLLVYFSRLPPPRPGSLTLLTRYLGEWKWINQPSTQILNSVRDIRTNNVRMIQRWGWWEPFLEHSALTYWIDQELFSKPPHFLDSSSGAVWGIWPGSAQWAMRERGWGLSISR